jgi:hypothetical protein
MTELLAALSFGADDLRGSIVLVPEYASGLRGTDPKADKDYTVTPRPAPRGRTSRTGIGGHRDLGEALATPGDVAHPVAAFRPHDI